MLFGGGATPTIRRLSMFVSNAQSQVIVAAPGSGEDTWTEEAETGFDQEGVFRDPASYGALSRAEAAMEEGLRVGAFQPLATVEGEEEDGEEVGEEEDSKKLKKMGSRRPSFWGARKKDAPKKERGAYEAKAQEAQDYDSGRTSRNKAVQSQAEEGVRSKGRLAVNGWGRGFEKFFEEGWHLQPHIVACLLKRRLSTGINTPLLQTAADVAAARAADEVEAEARREMKEREETRAKKDAWPNAQQPEYNSRRQQAVSAGALLEFEYLPAWREGGL